MREWTKLELTLATVPFPGMPNGENDPEVTFDQVRRAQGLVGELL